MSKAIEVAKTNELKPGEIRHIEIDGRELAVANINGKYYAFDDRCCHSSARLSMGTVDGNVVTCPFHGAQFDCTTGKKVTEANTAVPPTEGLPEIWKKATENAYNILSCIKTYDQKTYYVAVEEDRIKISLPAAQDRQQ